MTHWHGFPNTMPPHHHAGAPLVPPPWLYLVLAVSLCVAAVAFGQKLWEILT